MFKKVWHPTEEDLNHLRILFMVSIPAGMIFPLLFNIIIPSQIWYIVAFLWLLFTIALRVISSIRYSVITTKDFKSKKGSMQELPSESKGYFMKACIYSAIGYLLCMSFALFMIKFIPFLSFGFIIFFGFIILALISYNLWNLHNELEQGKGDSF